jgi:hypothetical protein
VLAERGLDSDIVARVVHKPFTAAKLVEQVRAALDEK